jgi:short-subunit dehydrogenase
MNENHTILILGAGSDIAKAIARKFAQKGYDVLLAGRNPEQMERLKKDLEARFDAKASWYTFDAEYLDTHDLLVSTLPVLPDIIVYTAGYISEQAEAQQNWKASQKMIDVNYAGAVSVLNRFAPFFAERNSGCIIGISSVAGDRGRGSNYIYGSTKAAFTSYLSGLRNELFRKNVQVLTVKPGFVYTKMTRHLNLPALLTARPEQVADKIYGAVLKKKNIVYVKPEWKWIMLIIRMIPEPLFKRTRL